LASAQQAGTYAGAGLWRFILSIIAPRKAGIAGPGDIILYNVTRLLAIFVVVAAVALVYELFTNSWQALSTFKLGYFYGEIWDPVAGEFSTFPTVVATLFKAFLALVLAVPIAVGTAIYIALYLPNWLRAPVSYIVEGIAAIPSVIIGLWGLFVLVPLVRALQIWLKDNFGWFFLFDGPATFGVGVLAGGIILALMITPIITAISRDLIRAVPRHQMEGMLALGATKWEAIWKTVLPYARVGIVGAVTIGLGRAIGETMAITMVGGNAFKTPTSLFDPAHSMASMIASEFLEAPDSLYISALFLMGLTLVGITIIVNLLGQLLVWHMTRGRRGTLME
jgi:phosphate transport system permease protein